MVGRPGNEASHTYSLQKRKETWRLHDCRWEDSFGSWLCMSHRYTAAEMSDHITAVATKSGMTKGIIYSLIPRSFPAPNSDHLQYITFLRTISNQKLKSLEPGPKWHLEWIVAMDTCFLVWFHQLRPLSWCMLVLLEHHLYLLLRVLLVPVSQVAKTEANTRADEMQLRLWKWCMCLGCASAILVTGITICYCLNLVVTLWLHSLVPRHFLYGRGGSGNQTSDSLTSERSCDRLLLHFNKYSP